MFGINEILDKLITKKGLTKEEKFKILHSKRIDPKVVEYLNNKLENLYIEILNEDKGSLFELMPFGKLEGWCWQTTESAIVFLNDDYIERGYLYFDEKTPTYYHSWICFKYDDTEYVLDPCLNFLCKKKDYVKIFNPDVKSRVSSKLVNDELIRQNSASKQKTNVEMNESFEYFLKSILGDSYQEYKEERKKEVIVYAPEDVNTPLYRNGAGYKTELEDGKIKKMTVHYYRIGD